MYLKAATFKACPERIEGLRNFKVCVSVGWALPTISLTIAEL
jgi:hypothetical protein